MITIQVKVTIEGGLHARPAAILVNKVNESGCNVSLQKNGNQVDARSILSIMTLGVSSGDEITLQVEGQDEERVSAMLQKLFENHFEL